MLVNQSEANTSGLVSSPSAYESKKIKSQEKQSSVWNNQENEKYLLS